MAGKREAELKPFAEALGEVISSMFDKKGGIKFSAKPSIERKDIIEWQGKMRIAGMEKFNEPTFISFVNYYLSEQDKQKKSVLGAVIIFVIEGQLVSILNKLGYPKVDDESETEMKEGCGKLCQDIGEAFKAKIGAMGYAEPLMTIPENYRSNVPQGVSFNFKEYDKFELNFSLENKKVLVIEMTLGPIRRLR